MEYRFWNLEVDFLSHFLVFAGLFTDYVFLVMLLQTGKPKHYGFLGF